MKKTSGIWVFVMLAFAATIAPLHAQVRINEIFFHAAPAIPEDTGKEWIELSNAGSNSVSLAGWRLSKAVDFTFTNATLASGGCLVVAANRALFQSDYPTVTNVLGDWTGRLGNGGDTVKLSDNLGNTMDSVSYSADGDWAQRRVGDSYPGQPAWWRGWQWANAADGNGKSIELINPALSGDYGQNWAASIPVGGTPGQPNSTATNNVAPVILDVQHYPPVPQSSNTVTVSARIVDELSSGVSVWVHYRVDGAASFTVASMLDNGLNGDGQANDGIFGAVLPAQPNQTIVEFYVRATDAVGHVRTWPAPSDDAGTQGVNALYQVDDFTYSGSQPVNRVITTASEWNAWLNLMDNVSNGQYSNAEMTGTYIRSDGLGTTVCYLTGIRNRGQGTRAARPHNLQLAFPHDHLMRGLSGLSFNSRFVESQTAGNALFSAAGLITTFGAPVQLRVNGLNQANAAPSGAGPSYPNSYQFGSYFSFEPYDGDWAANHVPTDPDGNIYKGKSWLDSVELSPHADLVYRGTNVALYRLAYATNGPTSSSGAYQKQSNVSADDWSDLINLTYVLSTNTPDANYVAALNQVVNVDQWVRYLAINQLLVNMETTISTGVGDDYSVYRGMVDPRFQFLNHDMDSVLGEGDTTPSLTRSIFVPANIASVNRFLKHPAVAPKYFAALKELADTTFSAGQLNPLLDQTLASWVPASYIQSMKDTAAIRRTNVLAQIPQNLTVNSGLVTSNGYLRTTSATVTLNGQANAIQTRSVLVAGAASTWSAWEGRWTNTVSLFPGINNLLVQARDANDAVVAQTNILIWYDDASVASVGGGIGADTTWTASGGPYNVASSIIVSNGVTLTIQPGTTLYLGAGVTIKVDNGGRILAEGTANAPIRFTTAPGTASTWGGLMITGAVGSVESRLAYTHFESNSATCIKVEAGAILLDHATFGTRTLQYLALDGASFLVRDCVFPTAAAAFELVHGTLGIRADGRGIFLRNFFGAANGYNDVVDFTGGNRPGGPIVHFLDNVLIGSGDDGLDLDGTDAWIEGNIFLHIHKNGAPDSSSAVSGGSDSGNTSEITVIGNLFYDCDQAALAKQGNFYTLLQNTIVHQTHAGGLDTNGSVVCLADEGTSEGAGCYLEGNLISDAEKLIRNQTASLVTYTNNLIHQLAGTAWSGPGGNNSTNNPLLTYVPQVSETTNFTTWASAQVLREWFKPRPGSPAIGSGPNGRDKGGVIAFGSSVSGEPSEFTAATAATLNVGFKRAGSGIPGAGFPNGSGFTHYKWRLDGGAWSGETSITNAIALSGLANGAHWVEVSGKLDSGLYQDAADFSPDNLVTTSRVWTVNTALPGLRLNEILVRNATTLVTNGESPDLVELFNAGSASVDLSGMGLTDDAANRYKFTFAAGTTLAPGQFLVLFSDSNGNVARNLGFSLDANGGSLSLFASAANGGAMIDGVNFGPQLADFSVGRLADGAWGLCKPSLGSVNLSQPATDGSALKINEWLASGAPTAPDDFVELFNPDPVPAAMGGLHLTDAPDGSPGRHEIAPLSFIAPLGWFAFKADGKTNNGPEHLNFRLAPEAGAIGLFSASLAALDVVVYGPQSTGVSQGRTPDGAPVIGSFTTPTPGAGNPGLPPFYVTSLNLSLMAYTNVWRYNQTQNLDGFSWTVTNYNDSAWPAGPGLLAFESNSAITNLIKTTLLAPTVVTNGLGGGHAYYFRTTLVITNSLTNFTVNGRMRLDDDAVIYINGTEVARIRLPAGTITNLTYGTLVNSAGSGDADMDETLTIPSSAFHTGTNVIAVEVHQISSTSSDIVWGLALDATRSVTNYSSLTLNEVLAENASFPNADGTITDWIEFYNSSAAAFNLAGYSLSDNPAAPGRWVFPAGVIVAPGEFLVVRCDPLTPASTTNGPVLNTGFGLDAAGDSACLFTPANALLDSITFGPQAADFSIGHPAQGTTAWSLTLPTPGSANIAATLGNVSGVRINEWAASVTGGPDWFELYNPALQPVALGGLYLTDTLPNRTKHPIAALSFIGVATNGWCKFIADSDTTQGASHVNFGLSASGEALGLFPAGAAPAIDSITFDQQSPDISEGRFPDGQANRVFFIKPSPGDANWLYLSNVVISEVLSHTDAPLEDAIELQNLGAGPVDIGGWYISDDQRDLKKFRVPNGTVIPAGGFKVFYQNQFSPTPATGANFEFNSFLGDSAWLAAADGLGALTGFRDYTKFGPSFNGVSFGRFLTSAGEDFTAMNSLSFGTAVTAQSPTNQLSLFRTGAGATNAYPRVGPVVISEIMYHPPSIGTNDNTRDEFIELRNISSAAVPLYDTLHPTNGWKLRDAVDFVFNNSHSIPAGGYLLIVSFDPATNAAALAAFRAAYGTNGVIVGPWGGKLDNGGESVELVAPDNPQTLPPYVGLVPYVLMDKVVYSDTAPWPTNADGYGTSLQRVGVTSYGNDPVNWIAAAPDAGTSGLTDTDGDGIPDAWEDANGLNKFVDDASLDPDGDGFTNGQEYIAGTNPQSSSSRLKIDSVVSVSGGFQISFAASAGRTYSILISDSLSVGGWTKLADVPAQSVSQTVSVNDGSMSGATPRFYRLVTPAMP